MMLKLKFFCKVALLQLKPPCESPEDFVLVFGSTKSKKPPQKPEFEGKGVGARLVLWVGEGWKF